MKLSIRALSLLAFLESTSALVPPNPRRQLLQQGLLTILIPSSASAADLYKVNPLTNPVLEKLRIWEQAEADNIKYDGELERGDAGNQGQVSAYPKLLIPILQISQDLQTIQTMVRTTPRNEWTAIQTILRQPQYEKIAFKKIFNAYGDNIYYADPDRANLYLGGGATPQNEQSIAYLLRNDILNNVEDLRAEVDFILKQPDESAEDVLVYSQKASQAMTEYLAMVPPQQLAQAKKLQNESAAR